MPIFLVRHAKAGKRSNWLASHVDDRLRPLNDEGRLQAFALAQRLATASPTSLWSSPFLRCIQTLTPLATNLELEVRVDERLAEANDYEPFIELLNTCGDGAVLCSHGDMIPMAISALERRGLLVTGERDSRKCAVMVLDRVSGSFATGHAWPPPRIK